MVRLLIKFLIEKFSGREHTMNYGIFVFACLRDYASPPGDFAEELSVETYQSIGSIISVPYAESKVKLN